VIPANVKIGLSSSSTDWAKKERHHLDSLKACRPQISHIFWKRLLPLL
jgi:hypothetical protein